MRAEASCSTERKASVSAMTSSMPQRLGLGAAAAAFLVRRAISLPALPSAATSNPNETLVFRDICPATPGNFPDGNQYWTISGRYFYALRVGPTERDILTAGISPLAQIAGISQTTGNVPPTVWNTGLIAPSVPPAAAAGLSAITF